jgi:hypothetical protein
MNYTLPSGKIIRISDSEIEKNMKILEISKEEAIQMYLEDEGIEENAEQENLCQKAKNSNIMRTIHGAYSYDKDKQKSQRERVRKENPTKEKIVNGLAEYLQGFAEDVVIENAGKLITFTADGKKFKLDLIQTREKKN